MQDIKSSLKDYVFTIYTSNSGAKSYEFKKRDVRNTGRSISNHEYTTCLFEGDIVVNIRIWNKDMFTGEITSPLLIDVLQLVFHYAILYDNAWGTIHISEPLTTNDPYLSSFIVVTVDEMF